MKIVKNLALIAPLVLVAGCSYNQRHPGYASTPTYNGEVISSTITPVVDPADRILADSVCQQFNRYGDMTALVPNIQVSAKDGTVTLTGTVPSEQERRMVDAVVEHTSGVLAVNDQLQVSPLPGAGISAFNTPLARRIAQDLRNRPEVAAVAPNIFIKEDNG